MVNLPVLTRFLGTKLAALSLCEEEEVLLVSDLHLRPEEEEKRAALEALLAGRPAGSLVLILGDLFDYWVGPPQGRAPGWKELQELLRRECERGLSLWVLHGNRDYQLGRAFERRTGAKVWGGGLLLRRGEERPLLCLHGDELCLADLAYQKAKRRLRSWPARLLLRSLPFALSRRLADRARASSRKKIAKTPPESMLPTRGALRALRKEPSLFPCDLLFGHIHRASHGDIPGEGEPGRFFVLPSFEPGEAGHALFGRSGLVLVRGGKDDPSFGTFLSPAEDSQ